MSENSNSDARIAKHGDKMIEIRVLFWTNNITGQKDTVIPKHAWDHGMVVMDKNDSHGIKRGRPQPFHSILDLQAIIAKVLVEQGVTLHTGRKLRKLVKREP